MRMTAPAMKAAVRKIGTSIDFLFGSGRAAEKTGKKYKKMKLVVD